MVNKISPSTLANSSALSMVRTQVFFSSSRALSLKSSPRASVVAFSAARGGEAGVLVCAGSCGGWVAVCDEWCCVDWNVWH